MSDDWKAGYAEGYAFGLQQPPQRHSDPITPSRKIFAAATLVVGLGSAAAFIASATGNKEHRALFGVMTISGIILGTTIATIRVLGGGPAPWEA
jgi:hypothetical protein